MLNLPEDQIKEALVNMNYLSKHLTGKKKKMFEQVMTVFDVVLADYARLHTKEYKDKVNTIFSGMFPT